MVREKVDEKILLLLYNTLVLPHLNYCAEIWGNTYDSTLKELIILHKRVIRIIGNLNYREHTGLWIAFVFDYLFVFNVFFYFLFTMGPETSALTQEFVRILLASSFLFYPSYSMIKEYLGNI